MAYVLSMFILFSIRGALKDAGIGKTIFCPAYSVSVGFINSVKITLFDFC
jgi:hypothetical protein